MSITRIPVLATIRDAYAFAFSHLGGVIGLIWVPMVVMTVSGFFAFQRYYTDLIDALASGNAANLGPSMLLMLGYFILALLLQAMMVVTVLQLAQGTRKPAILPHFAFGAPERRMFAAFLAFAGTVLVLILPALVAEKMLLTLAGPRVPDMVGNVLLVLSVYGIVLLAIPRFLALLPAIAAFEETPALRRAWSLSTGNFWRLLAILLAIFVPIFAVFLGIEALLLGQGADLSHLAPQQQVIASLMRARDVLPMVSGFGFMVAPLLIALFSGASLSAWRVVQAKPARALDLEV
jgi:hypothetical protein